MSQILERNGQPTSLAAIYEPIKQELRQVELLMQEVLQSELPWVDELLQHSHFVGGKRMRPVFVLLSGACCGPINDAHIAMAAALEIIHTASLIHDDVLDHAQTRRHEPTANSKWGNKLSVLLGDYLFTQAFCVAARSESPEAIATLAHAGNRVCAGEMRQNAWVGNFDLTEQEYLDMISEKTGELVGCGCRLGTILSNASEQQVDAFDKFGQDLGIAFQIVDDVLDLVGAQQKVGKTLGTDIANQKPTLPVIHALHTLPNNRRDSLLDLLTSPEIRTDEIIEVLSENGSLKYAQETASKYAMSAVSFANSLPESPYATALSIAAEFIVRRNH